MLCIIMSSNSQGVKVSVLILVESMPFCICLYYESIFGTDPLICIL